jgi:predicted peptidase
MIRRYGSVFPDEYARRVKSVLRPRFFFQALLILMLPAFAACHVDRRSPEENIRDRFAFGHYRTGDLVLPYRLSRPSCSSCLRKLSTQKKYPLIVMFHGAGERGTDNEKTMKHFLPMLMRADFPLDEAYVLIPQCDEPYRWVEVDWNLSSHRQPARPSEPMSAVLNLVQTMIATESIDNSRIYAVGLSMGGFAVWDVLARRPDLFAAGIAVCGGGDERTAPLFQAPVWAFHGARDQVVRPERSRNMVEALKKAGRSVRYTEYADEAHGSWRPAFQEPDLIPWLFSQRRQQGEAEQEAQVRSWLLFSML